jgi:hypothetical protein
MGQITDRVIAYRDGHITFETLCTFLADFIYKPSPPFGIWQMWGGGHVLDDTAQEMLGAAETLLTDDEFLALIRAIKSQRVLVHERGDDAGGHDGGQGAAE